MLPAASAHHCRVTATKWDYDFRIDFESIFQWIEKQYRMNFDDANYQFMQIHSGHIAWLIEDTDLLLSVGYTKATICQGNGNSWCDLWYQAPLLSQLTRCSMPLGPVSENRWFPTKNVPLYKSPTAHRSHDSQQACATASSWLTASEIMGSMIRQVGLMES